MCFCACTGFLLVSVLPFVAAVAVMFMFKLVLLSLVNYSYCSGLSYLPVVALLFVLVTSQVGP